MSYYQDGCVRSSTAVGDLVYYLLKYRKYSAAAAMVAAGDDINSITSSCKSVLDCILNESLFFRSTKRAGWRIDAIRWLVNNGATVGSTVASKIISGYGYTSTDIMIMLDDMGAGFYGNIDQNCIPKIISTIASGKLNIDIYRRHTIETSAEMIELSDSIDANGDLI